MIATAIAVPLEEKKSAFQPSLLDNNKPPLTADPKAQAPIAPTPLKAPLHKRDTPKNTDQKTNTAPDVNTQKAAAGPIPTTNLKPSNTRQTRDTQNNQDSYKTQSSGVAQKSSVPAPTNTNLKTPNNRPARNTPKDPVNNNEKNTAPVTPQKNSAPVAATPQKPQQNSRNRRDTVEQNIPQQPVTWNKDDKTKSSPPAAEQPSTLNADRKTRETQKNIQPTNDKVKASAPDHPEIAKVPLTSTNSHSRRDAPNPVEQSKLVPSGSVSGNVYNPSLQARNNPIVPTTAPVNHKRETQGTNTNIRYPVPVDQVLKQKTTDDKPEEAPVADK